LPTDDCTSAAPPTLFKGDAASTVTVTRPFANEPLTVVNWGAFPEAPVGLLLLQAGNIVPRAATVAAWHACAQNSRRFTAECPLQRPFDATPTAFVQRVYRSIINQGIALQKQD
jgi:hypothetical protein